MSRVCQRGHELAMSVLHSALKPAVASKYAPPLCAPDVAEVAALTALVRAAGSRTVIVTGAGVSTESGIPDYRGPSGSYALGHKPITHQEFMASSLARRRYWARSVGGFGMFSRVAPSSAHVAIAKMEHMGLVSRLITQNVDGLHSRAGSVRSTLVELHGSMREVHCMECGAAVEREAFQAQLEARNTGWLTRHGMSAAGPLSGAAAAEEDEEELQRPDGDIDLGDADFASFEVPPCASCGVAHDGVPMLKPAVVFFGDSVPLDTVESCYSTVKRARLVLAVGTSLQVLSGFRFLKRAHQEGVPIAVVNVGPTRADEIASLKIEAHCGQVLSAVCEALQH